MGKRVFGFDFNIARESLSRTDAVREYHEDGVKQLKSSFD